MVFPKDRLGGARAVGTDLVGVGLLVAFATAWLVGSIPHTLVSVHESCLAESVCHDCSTARRRRRTRQHGLKGG